jgi:hypothetical protein
LLLTGTQIEVSFFEAIRTAKHQNQEDVNSDYLFDNLSQPDFLEGFGQKALGRRCIAFL